MSMMRGLLIAALGAACTADETASPQLSTDGPQGAPYVLVDDVQVPVADYNERLANPLGSAYANSWGDKIRRWPEGKVRYAIATNYTSSTNPASYFLDDDEDSITWAVAHIEENTCIRMTKCDSPYTCEEPFILFVSAGGVCNSLVGTFGGINQINLDRLCGRIAATHEIYHSLGVHHEHQRGDRDEYVYVNTSNVQSAFQGALSKLYTRNLGPYDYASIMHYYNGAFSIDSRYPTIVTREIIGQASELSQGDIDTMQFLYNGCSDVFEAPLCMPSKDTSTVIAAPAGIEFSVQLSVEWELGGTVTVDYSLTTAPGFTTYRPQGASMDDSSYTEIFFTPSASEAGTTYTLGATFTAETDAAPSTSCNITVLVVPGPAPTLAPTSAPATPAPCFVALYGACNNGLEDCCQDGSYCKAFSPYYSQCVLGTAPVTDTPSTSGTPAPSSCASTIPKWSECTNAPDCCAASLTCTALSASYWQCL